MHYFTYGKKFSKCHAQTGTVLRTVETFEVTAMVKTPTCVFLAGKKGNVAVWDQKTMQRLGHVYYQGVLAGSGVGLPNSPCREGMVSPGSDG